MIIIMKKNEILELNGVEYTLELNRDSFLKIDQYSNLAESMQVVKKDAYEYIDEVNDETDPFAEELSDDLIAKTIDNKINTLHKIIERAFWIWLYPNHKLPISKIQEILKPYFDEDDKFEFICEKYSEYMQKCVEVRNVYLQEQKNLKALANK